MTNRYLPSRVVYVVLIVIVGVVTNAWHRNAVSTLVVLIGSVALAMWLATELGKK